MINMAFVEIFKRRSFAGPIFSFLILTVCLSVAAAADESQSSAVRRVLFDRHLDLLQEKGYAGSDGQEIGSRLRELIAGAGEAGLKKERDVVSFVLKALNHSPANLAGFPGCAFDRPLGHRLEKFGRAAAPGLIEARAEASACPLGGIGAGSFERHMNGNFSTWFLKSGWMVEDTVWADQFHVFFKSADLAVARTLSTESPPATAGLAGWAWNYPAGKGDYYALYPKSGFSYEENRDFPVELAVVQFSPVIPGNYRETSYPAAVFRWVARNKGKRAVEVGIMLTWENMVGWEAVPAPPGSGQVSFVWDRRSAGNYNEYIEDGSRKGILFARKGMDVRTGTALTGTMAMATAEVPGKTSVSYVDSFNPLDDGAVVWRDFSASGKLSGTVSGEETARDPGGRTAAALVVSFRLEPGERLEVPFVLTWDFPFYEFESGVKHRKKYTEYFGASGDNAFAIAAEALDNHEAWEKAVDRWQRKYSDDPTLPGWFKQALLNELYVLSETSIWDAESGLHTYLESVDYLMYGTFDVDSYCWHILKLWPELEKKTLEFIAGTVGIEDTSFRAFQYATAFPNEVPAVKKDYYWNTVKEAGMVPHDLGSPRKRPWVVLNAFDWQNANVWKDLNPKFPLRVWRYFVSSGKSDLEFLEKTFPACVLALDTLEARFGDEETHIPLNEGIPDQTYDTWRMEGETAYVGFLWLAALRAVIEMGDTLAGHGYSPEGGLRIDQVVLKYKAWYDKGRAALEELWDEKRGYYHIDARTGDIMTDQLFGVWYADMLGLGLETGTGLISSSRTKRVLGTIFETNVLGFGSGLMGAVNGRRADGGQLMSQQGDEVWVGTAYAFAAACALHGLKDEAMWTAYGLFHIIYSPFGHGYFFKTPEAYLNPDEKRWDAPQEKYGQRLFRPMKYMRAGAVWALYEALGSGRRKGK